MVILAQQLLSVGCWKYKKHDEFEVKCQFQHVSLRKKHQEKNLADCVTVTILIGICGLASVKKKHPHKKAF